MMNNEQQNELNLLDAKIDSFTLLIPIEFCEATQQTTFTKEYLKVYTDGDGEASESFYENYFKNENESTCTIMKYKKVQRVWGGSNKDFVQVVITSKHLLQNYFQGINKNNFHQIASYVQNDGVLLVDEQALLNSYVTDVDLCKDFQCSVDEFKELKAVLLANVLLEKMKYIFAKNENAKNGMFGIQYNERHKATPKAPFCKLYFKSGELLKNSEAFFDANLKQYEKTILKGIARLEATIKASRHKEALKVKFSTLNELLNIKQDELNKLHTSMINEYYNEQKIHRQMKNEKTSMFIIASMLKDLIRLQPEISESEILFRYRKLIECKYKRQRAKKVLLEAIKLANLGDVIASNESKKKNVNFILKNIGIYDEN